MSINLHPREYSFFSYVWQQLVNNQVCVTIEYDNLFLINYYMY